MKTRSRKSAAGPQMNATDLDTLSNSGYIVT